ncbi:MAG: hypothetical protein V4590_07015 [Bacteroidota bacterium]
MSRSLIIGLIITVAIISGLVAFFYINFVKVKNRPAIDGVPSDAAVILEIKNTQQTWGSFYGTDMWKDLLQNEAVQQFSSIISSADSLITTNESIQSMLAENKMTVSFHSNGGQKLSMLFIAEAGSYNDINGMVSWLAKAAGGKSVKRTFDKETVYDIYDYQQHILFSVASRDRLIILSADGTLVEESLRKLKYNTGLEGKGFGQAKAIAEVGSELMVYVNYQQMPSLLAIFNKEEYKNIHSYLQSFANWSVFDVNMEKDYIGISGVTFTDDSLFQFLDLFKTQAPIENDLSKYLPSGTAYALQLNFSNYSQFNSDLTEYLQNTGRLDGYLKYNDSIEQRYNISITEKLTALVGNSAVLAMNESMGGDYHQQLFALLTFKDTKAAGEIFESYVRDIEKRGEGDSVTTSHNGQTIRRLYIGNSFKMLYGNTFEHLINPFYVLMDNVFIMANDLNTLTFVMDALSNGNTLAASESYKQHRKHASSSSNISLFLSPAKCLQLPGLYANETFISALNRFQFDFKKFEYAEVQYANSANNTFFTNINIKFNPSFKEETKVLWATKLDTTFDMQPAIVINSETKLPCILVQDVLNNVYFVSNAGIILWKAKLSGKINSQVFEVDLNKNGEISYLFSTNKQVCLLNNKGMNAYGYPVRFPGTATAGINLFDFYGDSSYQYFVPLENNKIIGYDLNGKPVQGWNPKSIESRITTKLGGFTLGVGAYICGTASAGQLMVFPLKNTQPKPAATVPASVLFPAFTFAADTTSATIWVTDTSGNFVQYRVNGQLQFEATQTIATNRTDTYHAVVSGGEGGYTLLSASGAGFTLYRGNGKSGISKTFSDSTTTLPFFGYTAEKVPMIGYTEKMLGKVNWMDLSGMQYPTLPQEGVTPFTTGDILLNNANYLICGDKANNLRLYRLK